MFIWVWQLEKQVNRFGGIDKLIDYLKSLNINNVCIKYHEGSGPVGSGIDFRTDFLAYKDKFKSAGFTVGTWGYNYFNHWDDELNMIIDALNNSDYYIYDPEVDVSNKFEAAEYICSKVREAHPTAKIGYSSFPIVSYHDDIPYSIFNKYCDFASPQCYWNEMQWDINRCMDKMIQDNKNYGLDKPIVPSIEGYKTSTSEKDAFIAYGLDCGVWVLDLLDGDAEYWFKNNKFEDKLGGTKKVENLVVYNYGPDMHSAEILADFLNCPTISNGRSFDYNCVKNIYAVGGTADQYTSYLTKLISGGDRYTTDQAVLDFIKNGGK